MSGLRRGGGLGRQGDIVPTENTRTELRVPLLRAELSERVKTADTWHTYRFRRSQVLRPRRRIGEEIRRMKIRAFCEIEERERGGWKR
jgi:hypothetical protein